MDAKCLTCEKPIRFVKTEATGSSMPLDPDPVPDGNVVIVDGLARVLGPLEQLILDDDAVRFVSHFVTCPQSTEWRRTVPKRPEVRDPRASRRARDRGMTVVEQRTREWQAVARAKLIELGPIYGELTTDEAWLAGLPDPPPNADGKIIRQALGPVMLGLAREGLYRRTDRVRNSEREAAHCNPKRVWEWTGSPSAAV